MCVVLYLAADHACSASLSVGWCDHVLVICWFAAVLVRFVFSAESVRVANVGNLRWTLCALIGARVGKCDQIN